MSTTVVIPLDTSAPAESAIQPGTDLARQIKAAVRLISIIELPFEFRTWASGPDRVHFEGLMEEEASRLRYLRDIGTRVDGVPIETMVRAGDAPEQILEGIRDLEDVVIVMATHGVSGVRRSLIGTVTTRVVHGAGCPVIVVPASDRGAAHPKSTEFNKILVALDGSSHAERALNITIQLLGSGALSVGLVRVVETASWFSIHYDGVGYYDQLDTRFDALHAEASDYLDRVATTLRSKNVTVSWEVRDGQVDRQIEAVAHTQQPDLLVMSTHGRTGMARVLIGSVAERVMRNTSIPVMLVPPDMSRRKNDSS